MNKGQETPGSILIPLVFVIILSIFLLFGLTNNLLNLNGAEIASIILSLMLLSSLPFSWIVYVKAGIKPKKAVIFYYIFGNVIVMSLIFSFPVASAFVAFLFVVISPYFWKFGKIYSFNQLRSKKLLLIISLLVLSGIGMVFSNLLTSGLIVLIYYPLMIYAIQEITRTSQLQHTSVAKRDTTIKRPLRFMIKMTPYEYFVIGSFFVLFSLFQFYANFSRTGQPFNAANTVVVMAALFVGAVFIYYGGLIRGSSRAFSVIKKSDQ